MAGPTKGMRAQPPAHFELEIEQFSVLSSLDEYESVIFGVGGYKWSLSLYPNEKKDGKRYISLYLTIREKLKDNRKVDVNYKLFVHNKSQKEYLTIQEADGAVSSFDGKNTQRGFPRLFSIDKFKSDGYLGKDGSCTFGAEILVIETARKVETLTLDRIPPDNTHPWKIQSFSTKVGKDPLYSDTFTVRGRKWKLSVNVAENKKKKWLSFFLKVQDPLPERKVYVEFRLRVLDQLKGSDKEKECIGWVSKQTPSCGYKEFMPWKNLLRNFVHKDTLAVQVEIRAISTCKFSQK